MNELREDIGRLFKVLDDFGRVQRGHLGLVRDELPGDLAGWCQGRERSINILKEQLEQVIPRIGDQAVAVELQGRIAEIMELESLIADRIAGYRAGLKNKIAGMRRGRAALDAYGAAGNAGSPKVFNRST